MAIYEDTKGYIYTVSSGISCGRDWMTVRMKKGAESQHRVKSKNLPIRKTMIEAQDDLNAWAKTKKLQVVGVE